MRVADSFLPPVVAVLTANITGFKAKMGEAQAEMEKTGGASAGLKTAALGIAAAVVGIGYESAKLAVSFQAQMETLATQAGVPQSQIKSLGNSVLDLAGQVGFSPTSLAEALYHIESSFASVGITGPKAMELLKTAAEGAAIGHANLVDVTNALDAAVASGIPGVSDFNQAMGVLNATVGAGDMTMQDLSEAFSTGLLASVKGYGLSITDVGAALATFGDNNIRGANAATDLRMAVQALAVPAKSGETILAKMGIAGGQLAKDMQTGGLTKALGDLKSHMDKMGVSAQEQGQVLTEIFGKKAGVGATVLYDQLDRLKSKYPELTKSANNFGGAWAETQKTFSQKMKEVEATLAAVGVRIGEKLLPILSKLADWFVKSVGWLGAHKTVLEAIGVIAAGALAVGFWSAATAVWGFTTAILANPVFLIVEGLVALGVAVFEAYKHFTWFRDAIGDVSRFLVGLWKDIVHFAENWRQYWNDVVTAISGAWDAAYRNTVGAWNDVVGFLSGIWDDLVGIWNSTGGVAVSAISDAWDTVSDAVSQEWDKITGDLRSIWSNLVTLWNLTGGQVVSGIREVMGIAGTFVRTGFEYVVGVVRAQLEVVKGVAKAAWDTVTGLFQIAWDVISGIVKAAWDVISGIVLGAIDFVEGYMKAGWDVIIGTVKIAWDLIKGFINTPLDLIKGLLQTFVDFFTGKWGKLWGDVKSTASSVWNDIYGMVKSILGTIADTVTGAASNLWNGFINAIGDALAGVWNALLSLWSTIMKFFKDVGKWLWQIGIDLIQGLINGIGSMGNAAWNAVKGIGNDVIGGAKSILGIGSPSKVFHALGINVVEGLVNGMGSQHGAVRGAVAGLNDALTGGLAIPGVTGGGLGGSSSKIGGAGFGSDTSGLTVEVYMDGQKIQGAVRQQTLRYQGRNSRNNLSLAGVGS